MNYFTFASAEKPESRFYKFAREVGREDYHRGEWGIGHCVSQYDTYGDGATQHSGDAPVGRPLLADFLVSLAHHIATIENEDYRKDVMGILDDYWPREQQWSIKTVRFALSIKYKEGKAQWYSVDECKVSSADSRRYDRRWEKVTQYHESGTDAPLKQAGSILKIGNQSNDLCRIARWEELRGVFLLDNDGYCPLNVWELFGVGEGQERWILDNSWSDICDFVKAWRLQKNAMRRSVDRIEILQRNRQKKENAA